jgi:2,5-diketo-D-gluconate reductase A
MPTRRGVAARDSRAGGTAGCQDGCVADEDAVTLAGSGLSMPLLGFGTWQITGRRAYEMVGAALEVGYRHIDTATMYGNEAEVGRAIRDSGVPRADLFVTRKLPPGQAGRERQTLTASLRELGLDSLDLWLLHWPPRGNASTKVWRAMRELRDAGLTRAIGVSNYDIALIDDLVRDSGEAPAVNQLPWSPWDYSAAVVEQHRSRGIVLEGYSPFKRSDLNSDVLREIAAAHAVTPAQVVLRWHIDHRIVVIPKSAKPERIRLNHDVFGFRLTDKELARIDELG